MTEVNFMKEKFYITTAIAYASRKPHIGNTYEVIMTDAVARYKRQHGFDVFFLTGTDEHGLKIEGYAKERNMTPKEYVDEVTEQIRGIWDMMNTSYDKFIRTTDDYHERGVQKIFNKLYKQGDIYKGVYEGWYCIPDETFYPDTQIKDDKCPECGRPVQRMKEEAYFLRLSKYTDRLIKYIEDNPGFIEPESRKKEMLNNFLLPGLQDLCVSRTSFKWGIPVDFDDKHVIYVWIDALSNYITALGYNTEDNGGPDGLYAKYWPADVHIIGKDIMRFHSIYWIIMLMALDIPLPRKIFGHPWFNFGMDKMSKSRGNVLYADDLVRYFGVDGVRHYCLSEMPYATDGSITYESMIARYNADLANNLGNLVKRTLDMVKKYFNGTVPVSTEAKTKSDEELIKTVNNTVACVDSYMNDYRIADAVESIFDMLHRANKYIDENTPWVLARNESDRPRLSAVLYNLLETIRIGAVLLWPFITETAEKILNQLGTDEDSLIFGGLTSGDKIGEATVLFERIDETKLLKEIGENHNPDEAENDDKTDAEPASEKVDKIDMDDFMNVELRTARIIAAEPIPKAKNLLKLQVDLGYEKRQVVSGIAKFYQPEDLVGKKVIVAANLKPVTLRGVDSNGMILASGEETVRVLFLNDDIPIGERIR
ncbi:MAG: methionine--tRNA ligase [Eubacteriales bacterium]|nr:methionine--tRNA ligase [Eubacteriales bacterium]